MTLRDRRLMETETYKFYNANPKGRITEDCEIRAISLAIGLSWEDTIKEFVDEAERSGYWLDKRAYERVLATYDFIKCPQPRKVDGTKYTINEFCKYIAEPNKRYVIRCSHHLTCVVDKKINDIWNCGNLSVGNYYEN